MQSRHHALRPCIHLKQAWHARFSKPLTQQTFGNGAYVEGIELPLRTAAHADVSLIWHQMSTADNRNAHVFNFGRGFPGQQQQHRQPAGDPPSVPHQLLSILPILLMLAFTFFAMRPSEPVRLQKAEMRAYRVLHDLSQHPAASVIGSSQKVKPAASCFIVLST